MKYYYTNAANHILGPVDEADLQAMVAGGEVLPETHIVKENDTTWQPYCEIFPTDPYEAVHPLHRGKHPGQTSTAPGTRFRAVHISRNGEQEGPYSAEQLEERFRLGTIPGDAFYWHEGCEDWLPVREHPDFAPPLPTTFDILRMAHAVCLPPQSSPPPLPMNTQMSASSAGQRASRVSVSGALTRQRSINKTAVVLILMVITVAFAFFVIVQAFQDSAPGGANFSSPETFGQTEQKRQASDAALQDELQRGLVIKLTKVAHDGDAVQIFGKVTDTTAHYAIKDLLIKLKGLNANGEVIADTSAIVTSQNYLRPGKEAAFSSSLVDQGNEITSVVPELKGIAPYQILTVNAENAPQERTPIRPIPTAAPETPQESMPPAAASPAPSTSSSLNGPPQDPAPSAFATLSPAPETSPEPVSSAPAAQEAAPPVPATPSPAPETSPGPMPSAAASSAPSLPVGETPPDTSTEHTSCSVVGVPEGDALNVHSGPNSKSQVVAKLPNGYPDAQVVSQPVMNGKTEWVEIKFGGGTGWVTTKYLSRLPSDGTDAARTTPAPAPTPAGPLLRLKLFEDEAHTCRLLLPEDGWVPIESPPRGVTLAVEGPGGIRLGVRHLDGSVGERSLAVMFAREVKERFPFDDMVIAPIKPKDHSTKGARTVLSLSAQSSDPMQRMVQDMPDGPMKQGMLAGAAAAGPKNLTFFNWSVISEGSATWVAEVEITMTLESPAEIKSKMDRSREHIFDKGVNLSRQFETDPVDVYWYIRGYAMGDLERNMAVSSFDGDGLTAVINLEKQAADPKVAEDWNFIMDALTW